MITAVARHFTHVLGGPVEHIICVDENDWPDGCRSVEICVVHGSCKDQLQRRTLLATQPT
jgi:hypothetical protein